jgi:uncharacterized protein (TIGR00369 family)
MMQDHRLEELTDLFNKKSPIARHFGMKLSFRDDRAAIVDLPYNPDLTHSLGGIHGGVYATVIDVAGWFAVAAAYETSCWVATSSLTVHFLEPCRESAIRAVGKLVKAGKRQNVAEMELRDEQGRLIGLATGIFILLNSVPLPS